jgi:hypothetical protein
MAEGIAFVGREQECGTHGNSGEKDREREALIQEADGGNTDWPVTVN